MGSLPDVLTAINDADGDPSTLNQALVDLGIPDRVTLRHRNGRRTVERNLERAAIVAELLELDAALDDLRNGVLDDEPAQWRHAEEDRIIAEVNAAAVQLIEQAQS